MENNHNTAKEDNMPVLPGSIKIRQNGLLEFRKTINGKRISIYGRTKKEIYEKYRKIKIKKISKPKDLLFEDFAKTYLEEFKKNKVIETTYKGQIRKLELHILPLIGTKPLNKVTTFEIIKLLKAIPGERMKQETYNLCNEIYRKAKQLKFISDNPLDAIDRPTHKRKLGEALTIKEENEFIKKIQGHRLEGLFLFLLYTGARRTEGINFKMKDIDITKNTLHLRGTKTSNSDRYIPYFKKIQSLLKKFPANWQTHKDTVTQEFKKICPNHKLHDLRHTFATRCLEAGVTMKTVQKWLGHSTYEMTANTYSHVLAEFENKEIEKIDNIIPQNIPQ